ncbi:stage III sporulation protein SpoIIIAB [Tumebacillus permanentifrigoris]|uniref:Stage III sporulation protein AB n=1 Tax=Tumebacillus permanentifrigoris TaxID=378543 RepID=A0A316D7F2_9BACL|nr:stage III sporulation protein SpoIIIAB [Tumebacillus permanentifrigoris]PWK11498.1 stage III sporulation protein AB [Tumebacillus permanentifrigoris]
MIKLLGGVLVLAASTMAGFRIANRYGDRPKQLRHFVSALKVLETEIFYAATPLPEACQRIASRMPAPVGEFFQKISDKLRDGRGLTGDGAWQEALSEMRGKLILKETDRDVLRQFGRTLGVSDRADQIKHIHLGVAHLTAEEAGARDDQARNEKMWRYLGALLGLAVLILLY